MIYQHWPIIRRASIVKGKTLTFRDILTGDAHFILSLRTDEKLSRFINTTSSDIAKQRLWIQRYKEANDQAYFIIEFNGQSIGCVRLYDALQNSFCWGSWILQAGSPAHAAIESALMVYAYAVDHLGFERSHFTVEKGNKSVWGFHERFGAVRINEDEHQYFYEISADSIEQSRAKYSRYLAQGVEVLYELNE
jgi:RimJ/RimL family protein N-acetyltransferase